MNHITRSQLNLKIHVWARTPPPLASRGLPSSERCAALGSEAAPRPSPRPLSGRWPGRTVRRLYMYSARPHSERKRSGQAQASNGPMGMCASVTRVPTPSGAAEAFAAVGFRPARIGGGAPAFGGERIGRPLARRCPNAGSRWTGLRLRDVPAPKRGFSPRAVHVRSVARDPCAAAAALLRFGFRDAVGFWPSTL